MKVPQLGIALLLCMFLCNCSKDENPTPEPDAQEPENPEPNETPEPEMEVYFEAVISDNLNTDNSDNWLLTHDKEGRILDYTSFEKNDTIRFEISKTSDLDKFTVTDIRFSTLTASSPYTLNSYTEVVNGSSWIIGSSNSSIETYPQPKFNGNFRFSVFGEFPTPSMLNISDKRGKNSGRGSFSMSIGTFGDWRYEKLADIYEDNNYYITFMNSFGNTRYYYLEEPQHLEEYNLNLSDFSEFDSHILMKLPPTSEIWLSLRGFPETPKSISSPGYDFYNFNSAHIGAEINRLFKLGYLGNMFEGHSLSLTSIQQDYRYYINYFGAELPEGLFVPDQPSFNIVKSDINEFEMSTNLGYKRKVISWSNLEPPQSDNRRIEWKVFSSSTPSSVIGMIPKEITDRYPQMDVSELIYQSSCLYVQPYSHMEFLNAQFSGNVGVGLENSEFHQFD
ncbi:hypothetical protein [Ulvibacterium sp.]|uniref:hypothetical protein n=1 Tax=Ulvibacterium sp. TaxID=2665914 RepID=UPI003BA84E34